MEPQNKSKQNCSCHNEIGYTRPHKGDASSIIDKNKYDTRTRRGTTSIPTFDRLVDDGPLPARRRRLSPPTFYVKKFLRLLGFFLRFPFVRFCIPSPGSGGLRFSDSFLDQIIEV
ncbi:hypothetical protein V6N13_005344 [Hibiscus sabdariffa]